MNRRGKRPDRSSRTARRGPETRRAWGRRPASRSSSPKTHDHECGVLPPEVGSQVKVHPATFARFRAGEERPHVPARVPRDRFGHGLAQPDSLRSLRRGPRSITEPDASTLARCLSSSLAAAIAMRECSDGKVASPHHNRPNQNILHESAVAPRSATIRTVIGRLSLGPSRSATSWNRSPAGSSRARCSVARPGRDESRSPRLRGLRVRLRRRSPRPGPCLAVAGCSRPSRRSSWCPSRGPRS